MESRRVRKKLATKAKIVESAHGLFNKLGYEIVSMEAIAESADISKGTLYKYFSSKEAIVSAFWQSKVQAQAVQIEKLFETCTTTEERLQYIFVGSTTLFKTNLELAKVHFSYQLHLLGKNADTSQRSGFEQYLNIILKEGQNLGDIRSDISSEVLANYILLIFTSSCLQWFLQPDKVELADQLSICIKVFLQGSKCNA